MFSEKNYRFEDRKKKLSSRYYRVYSWALHLELARRYPQHAYYYYIILVYRCDLTDLYSIRRLCTPFWHFVVFTLFLNAF